ncbi:hypothetical protein FKP32DRAFT_1590982 [Trametes sanguinea]|nr:hypothetical protein FKP32DRAFT_1590982 [Trametes sanguinea]
MMDWYPHSAAHPSCVSAIMQRKTSADLAFEWLIAIGLSSACTVVVYRISGVKSGSIGERCVDSRIEADASAGLQFKLTLTERLTDDRSPSAMLSKESDMEGIA